MAAPQQTPGFTLQIRRIFAAPREKVFAAWAQREQLEQWMCKDTRDHVVIHHEQDIRTGGRYRLEVRDTAKGVTYKGQGIYKEVTAPEKISFTWYWIKEKDAIPVQVDEADPETLVTVEFLARGSSTEVVLTHATFGTAKDRDDHNRGWNGCFDILARVLQTTGQPV